MALGLVMAACGGSAADEAESAPSTAATTTTSAPTTTTEPATTTAGAPVTVLTPDGERSAIDIVEGYFAAIRADDMVRVSEMTSPGLAQYLFWVEYHNALGIEPELGDCTAVPAGENSATVVCQTTGDRNRPGD